MTDNLINDIVSIPDICGPSWWSMIHAWAKAIETAQWLIETWH